MSLVPAFDIDTSPLDGKNLIEASAGTGKTYTIEGVFNRLIVEKDIAVERILVITFTEAATAELKERIRGKLASELSHLMETCAADMTIHKERLQNALRNFDETAIFTIHGFCMRALQENSFESGSLFDTELVADQSDLILEIIEDFWRNHVYDAPLLWGRYLKNKTSPSALQTEFGNKIGLPYLKLIPAAQPSDKEQLKKLEDQYTGLFQKVRQTWTQTKNEVKTILCDKSTGLYKNQYNPESIPQWIVAMDNFLNSAAGIKLPDKFVKFCTSGLKVKKGKQKPQHILFDQCEHLKTVCESLNALYNEKFIAFKHSLYGYLRTELKLRKQKQNIRSFDDLLLDLWQALQSDSGNALAESIRNKYDAAMIDEFQDTDPVQYEIFTRIFDYEKIRFFLVGDPKQAIYSFRGADIFAYLNAKRQINHQSSLKHNWRSESGLLQAVNAFFDRNSPPPFLYEDIGFEPVHAPNQELKQKYDALLIDGRNEAPLHIWQLDSTQFKPNELYYSKPGNPINKGAAKQRIYRATAAEIGRLLTMGKTGKAVIKTNVKLNNRFASSEKGITPGDIAVLVLRNQEALEMQQALGDANIPSVLHTTKNVFDSHEALELQHILIALAEPGRENLLKAALATDILGIDGNALDECVQNEAQFEDRMARFLEYHESWEKKGFMPMFRTFLIEEKVMPRLIAFRDGERRITNLLHLAEILHRTVFEQHLGIAELVNWMAQPKEDDSAEEYLVRLESDADAVQLVTVHKSKGLEYPVVFCPFLWDDFNAKPPYCFHEEDNSVTDNRAPVRFVMDLASKRDNKNKTVSQKLAEKERLAENLRLLYVALTRARNRCYLTWGRINQVGASAMAFLLHATDEAHDDQVKAASLNFNASDDKEIGEALEQLRQKAVNQIKITDITRLAALSGQSFNPAHDASDNLSYRSFNTRIEENYRIGSYSSLVAGGYSGTSGTSVEEPELPDEHTIFTFPRGAMPGECMHSIFEDLDFTETDRQVIDDLIKTKLEKYGYDPVIWGDSIAGMVENTLSVKLDDNFRLNKISAQNRITEMEFFFPIKALSPDKLAALFSKQPSKHPCKFSNSDVASGFKALSFKQLKGYMHGFIDLVFQHDGRFYIIDWKSNHLGNTAAHYTTEILNQNMLDHYYNLQYHLYVVALHRYLERSLPGYDYKTHFGGVYYLFLRGIDPKHHGSGVFYDRPVAGLVEELSCL
ncbi:exodeoxyribonuclease V subunit beta [Desulfococcaceae bacterium HSG9]|nr:exodeoxyribonuclease V subunit beta [Desulfococcaceae bacterium HSG9]